VKTDDYAERQRRRLIHHPRGAIGRIGNSGSRLTPRPQPQRREHDRVAVLLVTQRPLHERNAHEYAQRALQLQRPPVPNIADPFAVIIFCTADPQKVDFKMRSKWARVMRYAAVYKDLDEPLADFIKRRGGINKVAARYARRLGRGSYTDD
jgi:hypothetical protein